MPPETPPAEPLAEEVRAAHATLSEHGLALVERALRDPSLRRRKTFAALDEPSGFVKYPLQSWPVFVKAERMREIEHANATLCRLVRSLPERVFGLDPGRLARFYGVDETFSSLVVSLLRDPAYLEAVVARGDFVLTVDGFRCLEMNMTGNLGGWRVPLWERLYREVPALTRFVTEEGIEYRCANVVHEIFRHVIRRARARGNLEDALNVAFLVAPENRSQAVVEDYAGRELRHCLAEVGIERGEVKVCKAGDLGLDGMNLAAGGRRIHAVFEQDERPPDQNVFRALVAGTVDAYNGPAALMLADKRNIALLSMLRNDRRVPKEDRRVIAEYVPWTRVVRPGPVVFEGVEIDLEELLRSERGRMVLKPAGSAHGTGVAVGRAATPEAWDRAIADALARQGGVWVAQEHAESLPFLFQRGAEGVGRHDLVWGLFVFGDTPAGGFLRMMPQGGEGVVNAARGASEGVVLEVDR